MDIEQFLESFNRNFGVPFLSNGYARAAFSKGILTIWISLEEKDEASEQSFYCS